MITAAEYLVRALREAGVPRIYGLVGDSLNPIVDAIRRTDGIDWCTCVLAIPDFGTDHPKADFRAIAASCGIHSARAEKPAEVREALTEAFAHPGQALVELITDPNALAIPPKITASQVRGFTLGIGRSVLAGGAGTMAGLGRSNLRNIPRP
jgi:thiamine pyrophosphate-dependent acetolactate synthase large subunit-like protein